ncbi:MAG: DNA polymerase IV, partial [Selenomonadaceae bacterium]
NEKLCQLGFKTIGDIAAADRRQLEKLFGGRLACHLMELAHGRDEREVEPERATQSIGNEVTFAQDLTQQAQAECELLALAEKVGWRLRQAGVKARTVTLKIRTASFRTITRSRTLPDPTNFDRELYQTALDLYRQTAIGEGIRLLGITGSSLLLHEQESLFGIDDKQKKLYQAVDSLKVRFGDSIITKAQLVGRNKKE